MTVNDPPTIVCKLIINSPVTTIQGKMNQVVLAYGLLSKVTSMDTTSTATFISEDINSQNAKSTVYPDKFIAASEIPLFPKYTYTITNSNVLQVFNTDKLAMEGDPLVLEFQITENVVSQCVDPMGALVGVQLDNN